MSTFRSGVIGLLAAFAVVAMVFGALSLGMLEAAPGIEATQTPRSTLPPPNLTPLAGIASTPSIPSPIGFRASTPTLCPQPSGWEPYVVMAGDDLGTLAETRGYSLEQILAGNCLISEMIIPDVMIYLPPARAIEIPTFTVASSTPTAACQRPAGWIGYIVKRGDTLTRISIAYRVSIGYLKQVNCLLSDTILPGWIVWVPNVATSTFTASPTFTEKPPEISTPTWTLTHTPTITLTSTTTPTPTSTSTATQTLTPSVTPTVTDTPTPTTILSETPTPTSTSTSTPTQTSTDSPTPAPTLTDIPPSTMP